jgi:hypothetical protein
MCCILLGLVVDLLVPGGWDPSRLIKAVRALLDFLYLAQYPCHTTDTILQLQDCLSIFHDNKQVFIDIGVREHINIPKFHSLTHYASSIRKFGTTDNYNTEQSERLHIDFTKNAYRSTNRKDEYPQMTLWLERHEKIQRHAAFIKWRQLGHQERPQQKPLEPPRARTQIVKMAQNPSIKAVSFNVIDGNYGAFAFQDELADFIARVNNPGAAPGSLPAHARNTFIPFHAVPVYHRIKFTLSDNSEIVDAVHIRPEQKDSRGRIIPSRFDTVLVERRGQDNTQGQWSKGKKSYCQSTDLVVINLYSGCRIGQVRLVFQIPSKVHHQVFPLLDALPIHLAYVEWFSSLSAAPDPKHLMHRVSRSLQTDGSRCAEVIPVDSILCSVHLIPRFGPVTPRDWSSFTVLEQCHTFYVNPFTDRDSYLRFV